MIIEVKSPKHRFHVEFYGKFNIITGASGSHKTHFLHEISRAKKNASSVHCKCVNDDNLPVKLEKILLFTNETIISDDYHDFFKKHTNCIIIIDESSDVLHKRDIGDVLRASKNYFLLLGRKIHGWLPISIDSIYEFQKTDGVLSNVPSYCEHNHDLITVDKCDYILTEDSGSGREFFVKQFPTKTICSRYVSRGNNTLNRDNSQLHNFLEDDLIAGKENILVVFDAAAYGSYYSLLLATIATYNVKVSILSWNSFENYILASPYFGKILTKEDVKCDYNSLEQLSTAELKKLIPGYNKGSLPKLLQDTLFKYGVLDLIK